MMQITFPQDLDHWKQSAQFLGVALNPDLTPRFLTQLDQFAHLPLLSLKLWQKIRSRAKMVTGVTRGFLCGAMRLLWFETVPVGKTNSVEIVPDMLPFDLLLLDQLFGIDWLWYSCRINAYRSSRKSLFPGSSHGGIKQFGVHHGHMWGEV